MPELRKHMQTNTDTLALLGAAVTPDGVSLRVWAPNAQAVAVTGDFTDWDQDGLALAPDPDQPGTWELFTAELENHSEYQFIVTAANGDKLWRNDPRARRLTNSSGNSIVYADDFDWGDDGFQLPAWNELVIYEMHVGTFNVTEEGRPGTFATALERLDYLVELGINCIEVMPVCEFAGDFSWGYNPAHPYAVEEAYGGPDGLKTFVKTCHSRGIAVILDVVYNHFGPSDLAIWQFDGWSENGKGGIYFYNDWKSSTPWGDTRPDYGREEVRAYILDNAHMWLSEFRCDGLRMDMIPYMRHVSGGEDDGDAIEEGYTLLREVNVSIRQQFPGCLTIAEDLHGNNFVTDAPRDGGLGFGSQWDGDFVHPVRAALIAQHDDQRSMDSLRSALLRRYGNDAFHRVIYTESHDEVSNGHSRVAEEIAGDGQGVDNYFSVKRSMLGAAMTLTAPGIPMLFQGQALLEDKWFSDNDPLDWGRLEHFSGIANQYRDLIRLRRNFEDRTNGLRGQHTQLLLADDADKIFAYLRWAENPDTDGVLVILNFSNQAFANYGMGVNQAGEWRLLYNGDWAGYTEVNTDAPTTGTLYPSEGVIAGFAHAVAFDIGPYGALIYGR